MCLSEWSSWSIYRRCIFVWATNDNRIFARARKFCGFWYITDTVRRCRYVCKDCERHLVSQQTGWIHFDGLVMRIYIFRTVRESGRNVIYELITPQQTEIQWVLLLPVFPSTLTLPITRIRLQLTDPGIRIPLKLSVYPESRTPASQAASPFLSAQSSGTISGVLTERSMCSAGNFLIVPSAQRPSVGKRFLLFVYSSACPVSVTQQFIDAWARIPKYLIMIFAAWINKIINLAMIGCYSFQVVFSSLHLYKSTYIYVHIIDTQT